MSNPKDKKPAHIERRVRVTFFLVAEKEEEREAVVELISYLDKQYVDLRSYGDSELPVTGFTHSAIPSNATHRKGKNPRKMLEKAIFWGHWWTEEEEEDTGQPLLISIKKFLRFMNCGEIRKKKSG